METESRIGIISPQQMDHVGQFIRGRHYLNLIEHEAVKQDWTYVQVVKGFMWGIVRELELEGKGNIVRDLMRQNRGGFI